MLQLPAQVSVGDEALDAPRFQAHHLSAEKKALSALTLEPAQIQFLHNPVPTKAQGICSQYVLHARRQQPTLIRLVGQNLIVPPPRPPSPPAYKRDLSPDLPRQRASRHSMMSNLFSPSSSTVKPRLGRASFSSM